MNDSIDRQAAIDAAIEAADIWDGGYSLERERIITERMEKVPAAQPRWIPIKTRPLDEEEREYYQQYLGLELDDDEAITFDCPMPCDGQEVWVCSKCGNVWQDTCVVDVGIGLEENGDWLDIVAWMPFEKPEPWKGENDDRSMPV